MKISTLRALQRRPRFDLDGEAANEHWHFRRYLLPALVAAAALAGIVLAAQIGLAVERIHDQRQLAQQQRVATTWRHAPFLHCQTTVWRELHPRARPCEAPCATIDRTEAC